MTPAALTIAGSDPSGGAGLQADLKTFHQHGVYGMSVVTLLTVQNTRAVSAVQCVDAELVMAQLSAVVDDIPPAAAKTGALGCVATIEAVAGRLAALRGAFPLVVDPVMISKHGHALLPSDAVDVLRRRLLPLAWLTTPNVHEATALAETPIIDEASAERAAVRIAMLGVRNVLIKRVPANGEALDLLWTGTEMHRFSAAAVGSNNLHGSGCVFSAAVTALVARGNSLEHAVISAKRFVTQGIRTSPGLGRGCGPLNMLIHPSV